MSAGLVAERTTITAWVLYTDRQRQLHSVYDSLTKLRCNIYTVSLRYKIRVDNIRPYLKSFQVPKEIQHLELKKKEKKILQMFFTPASSTVFSGGESQNMDLEKCKGNFTIFFYFWKSLLNISPCYYFKRKVMKTFQTGANFSGHQSVYLRSSLTNMAKI